MAETKRYYWLKLKSEFFTSLPMKKLRKIAGGDTYTIIYLKLQLLSLKDEGILTYEGIEDTFCDELALALDEDPDNVRATMAFLQKMGLIEASEDNRYLLTDVPYLVGKETEKAELMRRKRAADKAKELEDSNNVTPELPPVTNCYTEIEIEKEIEKDKYIHARARIDNQFAEFWAEYPRKVGKPKAKHAFTKAVKDQQTFDALMDGLRRYKQTGQWNRDNGEYIPHPTTWLNQRRWEDDIPVPARASPNGLIERTYTDAELTGLVSDPIKLILQEGNKL